jgi:tetratricopeptide (TPR) repeat protein
MPSQPHRTFRILCAGLSLAVASPALGQGVGIDLSTPPQKTRPEKPAKKDKKKTKRTKKPRMPGAAKPAPTRPVVELPAPPPPAVAEPAAPPPPVATEPAAPAPAAAPAAARPAPPARPTAPMTLQAIDVSSRGAGKQRLEAAKRLFQEKSYETAALAFYEILRDPRLAEDHDEARYQLAKCLAKLKLHYSALAKFDEILSKGSQGSKYFHTALEWLFYIGRRTANEQVILSQVARFANESFPPAYEDKFHYLLAKYNFERGQALVESGQAAEGKKSYDEARRLAGMVRQARAGGMLAAGETEDGAIDEGNVFAQARFLDGMVLYAEGDQQAALEAFKEVVRLTNPRKAARPDKRLREVAFLQLARIHYEHKQNRYAIFYYGKMPWGEERWLEGLWESSYAHYRIGDYEKSLGNLLTLHSPYFRDEYFPESHILKAIIYFENCRYPEARAILEGFNSMYEPVHQELVRLTGRGGPASSYFDLIERTEKETKPGDSSLMRRIMKVAFTDKNIKRLNDSILEIENEIDVGLGTRGEGFRASALAKDLGDALRAQRVRLVDEAGARARQKLEYERDGLRELLEQGLRIKIEVSRKEREALEGALAKGGRFDVIRPYKYSVAVDDEHLYWPYEGEFWRDELGTYSYTLTKGCRDQLSARPPASR